MTDFARYSPCAVQQSLSVAGTAVSLTMPTTNVKPRMAMVSVYTATIRFLTDGTTVTAATGHQAGPGDTIYLFGVEVSQASFIREGGSSATLQITYYT